MKTVMVEKVGRWVLAAVLAWVLLVGCSEPGATRLRVLSYNIHHGEGLDGRIDLERIASVIRASEADLVALQEVDQSTERSGGVDQPVLRLFPSR